MKILLTGANGYIGLRLLPSLLDAGHAVVGLVRDKGRFPMSQFEPFLADGRLTLLEGDMLEPDGLPTAPNGINAVYITFFIRWDWSEAVIKYSIKPKPLPANPYKVHTESHCLKQLCGRKTMEPSFQSRMKIRSGRTVGQHEMGIPVPFERRKIVEETITGWR